jgi:hypothetical protein
MDCFPHVADRISAGTPFQLMLQYRFDARTPIQLWRLARVAQLGLVFLKHHRVPLTLKYGQVHGVRQAQNKASHWFFF